MTTAAQAHVAVDQLTRRQQAEEGLRCKASLTCPDYLSPGAKAEWKRLMKLYRTLDSKILCDLDTMGLVIYCEAAAIYKKAQETWAKYGLVVSANPESQRIMDKCFDTMKNQTKIINDLAEQLCLTPIGRARMGIITTKEPEIAPSSTNDAILAALKGRVTTAPIQLPKELAYEEDDQEIDPNGTAE